MEMVALFGSFLPIVLVSFLLNLKVFEWRRYLRWTNVTLFSKKNWCFIYILEDIYFFFYFLPDTQDRVSVMSEAPNISYIYKSEQVWVFCRKFHSIYLLESGQLSRENALVWNKLSSVFLPQSIDCAPQPSARWNSCTNKTNSVVEVPDKWFFSVKKNIFENLFSIIFEWFVKFL